MFRVDVLEERRDYYNVVDTIKLDFAPFVGLVLNNSAYRLTIKQVEYDVYMKIFKVYC